MEKRLYYYFYKITNEINGMYYYGVHSTYKLDDGYMGSGYYLKRAQEKYGINNFKKEILKFFDSRDEMMNYEKEVVNSQMINRNNPMCYNIVRGGWGSHEEHITTSMKGVPRPKEAIEKSLETARKNGTYERLSKENEGYNNPYFKSIVKEYYEKDAEKIVKLLLNNDLSDSYIIFNLFNKNVHIDRLLNYYENIGLLKNKKYEEMKTHYINFERVGNYLHQSPLQKKTIYENSNVKPTAILLQEYFDILPKIIDLLKNGEISDSLIFNLDKKEKTNYCDAIKYFSYLGIFKEIEKKKVKVKYIENINGKQRERIHWGMKTFYEINYKNAKDSVLFDKEFNTYGIDENGRTFQNGRLF